MTGRGPVSAAPLPAFYLIVDDVRWLERFADLPLGLVQLRLKGLGEAELGAQIRAAVELCRAGPVLVVNDHWRIAIEAGAPWVHLGQEDLDGADLAAIRAAGLRLGVSTHDAAERARALAAEPDYVALGPIWETRLKRMAWAPQGLEKIGLWRGAVSPVPLVAIGGITLERAEAVWAAGADTIAVVTDVLWHADPHARLAAWLRAAAARDGGSAG